MLNRVTRICYHRRGLVLAGWIILLLALLGITRQFGGAFRTEFKLPGSESQAALDILRQGGFESRTGDQGQIVFQHPGGIDEPGVRQAMEEFFGQVAGNLGGASVASPYSPEGAHQVSADRTIAYAEVNLSERDFEGSVRAGDQIEALRSRVNPPGVRIELGGDMFAGQEMPASEAIGITAAMIILLIAFGSLLAMGLPIVTALFGLGCGVSLVGLSTRFMAVPAFTTPTAAMLGIGVGIDYALLIVSRYRQGLNDGLEPEEAVILSMGTAGRAVLFAGTTVVIAVLGMFFINLALMSAVAIGAALSVLMTMLASLTLLPALLSFVGRRIDRFGLPHRSTAEAGQGESVWHRWSQVIQRYPWPAAIGAVVILLVLASPTLSLRLGFGDAGNRPTTDTSRRAYDLLSQGFGPGFNGPLVLAARTPDPAGDFAALQRLAETLNHTPGIAFASPAQPNPGGTAAVLTVIPATAPQDKASSDLVHRLRDDLIPPAMAGSTAIVRVGGMSAGSEDFSSYVGERMPAFFAAVLTLSFLLLMVVFRSLLVPLKAVVMNMLSIGAAFGAMVAVFQWGWGAEIVGVGKEGPIDSWAPMMLFAIVFGLSMDYEVFLLSRIREEYDRTNDNAAAVADGLAATARVISAAAAIMVCVFASFVLGHDRSLKLFGFGLAFAVFIDATVVRLVLVPATMELLGRANWWLPGWLGRLIPAVNIEAGRSPRSRSGSAPGS